MARCLTGLTGKCALAAVLERHSHALERPYRGAWGRCGRATTSARSCGARVAGADQRRDCRKLILAKKSKDRASPPSLSSCVAAFGASRLACSADAITRGKDAVEDAAQARAGSDGGTEEPRSVFASMAFPHCVSALVPLP
jgi:hypothetical protein